ncbi:MAG: hypothetical protein ACOC56_04130 [Atribacterota bacterium]
MKEDKKIAISLAVGGSIIIFCSIFGLIEGSWLGVLYVVFTTIMGFKQWIDLDNQRKEQIEEIIEKCVIIKSKDIPKHMAGLDLTWLDREIKKIKDRLLNRLGGGE